MKKFLFSILAIAVISISFIGCSNEASNNPISSENSTSATLDKRPGDGQTIVGIASSLPDFSYLVAAVKFAGLDGVLNGNRQFTVFAPTNEAFDSLAVKLGYAQGPDLLIEANRELVTNVLLYHVSPGNKSSQNVLKSGRVNTLLKQFIESRIENGVPQVGNMKTGYADIIATDIRAQNGTIHVIDKVLLPR
jgi:uncharacterized surface protein with fasciclin (FAS1) repeats